MCGNVEGRSENIVQDSGENNFVLHSQYLRFHLHHHHHHHRRRSRYKDLNVAEFANMLPK
jgi:hypothetical protein